MEELPEPSEDSESELIPIAEAETRLRSDYLRNPQRKILAAALVTPIAVN